MELKAGLRQLKLATVCEEARCPNIGECWSGTKPKGDQMGMGSSTSSSTSTSTSPSIDPPNHFPATATIMIMGDECTRGCRFCSVKTSRQPRALDPAEPSSVAQAIASWDVGYIVITSVDRDDLEDGGSRHFAETVRRIRERCPEILLECLTGDFGGRLEEVARVTLSGLHVHAHNIETVERLTPTVRDHRASYRQSLGVLEHAKQAKPSILTKSSIMLGCGETEAEVRQALKDLRVAGVDCVTMGQYMRPTKRHMKVERYVEPGEFEAWGREALSMGFLYAPSGPLVRSSYRAGEFYMQALLKSRNSQT